MNLKSSNKAPLGKILESSLANEKAARNLQGMVGIKGSFTLNAAGTAISDVVGSGFRAAVDAVTAGAFHIYLDARPVNVLGAKAIVFTEKAVAVASDAFTVDVSGWDMDATIPYVTFRCVAKAAPHAVQAPGADCIVSFEINCTYEKDVVGYY